MAEHRTAEHPCDIEALSAWLDGELDEAARQRVEAHLAACPACMAQAAGLRELAAGFVAMRGDTLGYNLAGVLEGRLADAAARARPASPAQRPGGGWLGWLPAAFGAAASLALGIGLGSALLGGGAPAEPPTLVSAMRVFDPLPPGSICIGLEACYTKESQP